MKRRQMLLSTGVAVVGLSTFPMRWVAAAEKKRRLLYFTRSAGFEHSVVKRTGDQLSHSEKVMVELGKQHGFDVECTKDGSVFDGDLSQFDAIAFYTSADLTKPCNQPGNPMSPEGVKRLLDAVAGGKGFVAFHAATDSFHSKGNQLTPYIAMVGGEFVTHGPQQAATMRVTSPAFPGMQAAGRSFDLNEEWYSLKNFAKDLHVILVQETEGMKGDCYQRPPFPATWARRHGKGRVYHTSLGHREDIWTNPKVQEIFLGGLAWAFGNVAAEVPPNIDQVTPQASQMPK